MNYLWEAAQRLHLFALRYSKFSVIAPMPLLLKVGLKVVLFAVVD